MKKRLLFVINTLGHAGAEAAMIELMKYLAKDEEYDISLYVLMGQGEMIYRIPESVHLLNRTYDPTPVLAKGGKGNMIRTILKAAVRHGNMVRLFPYLCKNAWSMLRKGGLHVDKLLWRMLSDGADCFNEEYDLAIAYLEGGATYYVADHVMAKAKAAFVHIDYGRAGYTRELDGQSYQQYGRVFTVSDEVRQHFLEIYPECADKTTVFHNLIDQEGIRAKAKESGGFSEKYRGTRLLTVGRLTQQKAYDIAIPAMKLLVERGYEVQWHILGDGPLRQALESQIAECGLQGRFVLEGAKENPYPFFAQADIYVHATRYEGKSIAIQEAQTLGKPIVASDCSGNREQITDGEDGLLCDLTPQGIADAIARLIENPDLAAQLANRAADKKVVYEQDMQMLYDMIK